MIGFSCLACGKELKVKEDLAGKKGKCPYCGEWMRIPEAAGARQPQAPRSGSTGEFNPDLAKLPPRPRQADALPEPEAVLAALPAHPVRPDRAVPVDEDEDALAEVDDDADECLPVPRRRRRRTQKSAESMGPWLVAGGVGLVVLVAFAAVVLVWLNRYGSTPVAASTSPFQFNPPNQNQPDLGQPFNPPPVNFPPHAGLGNQTKENYDLVRIGMTENQVIELLGQPAFTHNDGPGVKIFQYAVGFVTFQNGRVIKK